VDYPQAVRRLAVAGRIPIGEVPACARLESKEHLRLRAPMNVPRGRCIWPADASLGLEEGGIPLAGVQCRDVTGVDTQDAIEP
jgi:hypothetical protein